MIKRYLFIIVLLFAGMVCRAQSLSLEELQSLTAMPSDQLHNYLIITKQFKPLGKTMLNGKSYEQFRSNRIDPGIAETLSLGQTNQLISGNTSRQVIYHSLRLQDINSFLAQAKRSTMTLVFQGKDTYQHIFQFDNSLFMMTVNIGLNKKFGKVLLDEK